MILEEQQFGNYYTFIGKPDNFDSLPPNSLPVLIFLHGSGEVGGDPNRVINSGGSNPIQEVSNNTFKDPETEEDLPILVIAPHAMNDWSGNGAGRCYDDINANKDMLKADMSKVSITGLSLGGIAISMLMSQPTTHTWYRIYAAAYPLGGSNIRYNEPEVANAIERDIPFIGYYGENDLQNYVGDPNSGKSMVQNHNAIEAVIPGYYPLHVVEGGGHNAATWGAVYKNYDKNSVFNIYHKILGLEGIPIEPPIEPEPPIDPPTKPEDDTLYVHNANGDLLYTMKPV